MDFLKEVEKRLDMSSGEKMRVMSEVRSHYLELEEELVKSGMSKIDAGYEASRRMGYPDHVAARFQSVSRAVSWKSSLLTALPAVAFFAVAVTCGIVGSHSPSPRTLPLMWTSLLLALTLVMAVGSIMRLSAGRRPEWLATWLPLAIVMPNVLVLEGSANLAGISLVLMLGILGAWALRGSVKYAGAVIALAAIASWRIAAFASPLDIVFIAAVMLVLLNTVAIKLFAGHEYGNSTQSALFLLSFYNCMFLGLNIVSNLFRSWQPGHQGDIVALFLLGTLSGFAARSTDKRLKITALFIGSPLIWMVMLTWTGFEMGAAIPTVIYLKVFGITSVLGALSILPPMIYERIHRMDTPELAV